MVQQNLTNPVPAYRPDYIYWTKHYAGLFWRWKWYILLTFPALVVTWLLLVLTFGKVKPELSASVLLGLENPSTVLVLPEATPHGLGKMQLIQSRNFLREIVDSLSLNLMLPRFNRSSIFSLVSVDSMAVPGKYHFSIDEKSKFSYTIWLTNKKMGIFKKAVATGTLPSLDTLRTTGMILGFTQQFLKKPLSFDFFIISRQDAVEDLRRRLTILGNTKRDPMQEGVVLISLIGTDPELISTTINIIADNFVKKNLSFRKRKTSEVMKALQLQLKNASEQLLQDENRIRVFKEENPKVGLGLDAQNAISNITFLESKNLTITGEIEEANGILQRLSEQADDDQAASEALLFLSSRKNSAAIVMQQDFNTQLQQKMSLIANRYSTEHPLIKEAQAKIDGMKARILPLLRDFIKKQEEEIAQSSTQKSLSMNQLRGLPQKEMQLAALTRQQQINSEIYSNILSRYNQAKIADETEVPDIYIMDYSVPPEVASARKELMKLLIIGLLICLLISFGPAMVFDFFDKKPRSEEDLKRFMPYPVLEMIPLLKPKTDDKKQGQNENHTVNVNSKLLVIGPIVTYDHELFRSLREKLNYHLKNFNSKSVMVTSYDSEEGKSLITANLAIMSAQQHIPTLLIDADMRRGVLHEMFAIDNRPGLSDILLSEHQITEQMLRSAIKPTIFSNLFLLTCGFRVDNSTELLTRARFKGILQWIDSRFSMTIIDAPPICPVTDPVIINSFVSGSILVVRAGKTNTAGLNKVISEYPALKQKILGLVLNGITNEEKRRKYKAFYYRSCQNFKQPQPLLLTSEVEQNEECMKS